MIRCGKTALAGKALTVKAFAGVACVGGVAAMPALAEDIGNVTLFGQTYAVQRFDYTAEVAIPDPLAPGLTFPLIEVEGAHWLGNDRMLLSMDGGDSLLTVKNIVVEVRLDRDGTGKIVGLSYVRTIVENDPFLPGLGGFDLSPCGLTINTGTTGPTAGQLLVGDSELNAIRGYSLAGGSLLATYGGGTANPSFDDLAYAPTNDSIYTINEDAFLLVPFSPLGVPGIGTTIPGLKALNAAFVEGSPKGMVYLPDVETVPAAIRGVGGSILITLDDNNPGLQVFELDGDVLGTEALTNNPANPGIAASLLDQGVDCADRPLQLEAAAFDPATGTLFLINEGAFFDCSGFFVLTPVDAGCPCPIDYDNSGSDIPDISDLLAFFEDFNAGAERADVTCTGAGSVPDVDDLLRFFEVFNGGC